MKFVLVFVFGLNAPGLPSAPAPIETAGIAHLMRGLHFLSKEQFAAAVPHLRLAILYDATSPFVHVRLSQALRGAGRPKQADAIAEQGLSVAPEAPSLNLLAGISALQGRRYGDAVARLRVASEHPRTRTRAAPPLMDALLWRGQVEHAQALSIRYADADNANVELVYGLAAAFEDHGVLLPALQLYRRVRAQRPAMKELALAEMRVLELRGEPSAAAKPLVGMIAYSPADLALHLKAYRLLLHGHRDEANAFLKEAQRLAGRDSARVQQVVRAMLAVQRPGAAWTYLAKAPIHRRDRSHYLAMLDRLAGRPRACIDRLSRARDAAEIRQRVACMVDRKRMGPALEEIERLWSTEVPEEDISLDVAMVASRSDTLEGALRLFDSFVRKHQERLSAKSIALGRSALFDHFGRGPRAIEALLAVAKPEDFFTQMRLADLYSRHGRSDRALVLLERGLDASPADPGRLNALGFTLAESDEPKSLRRAEVMLRRAFRLRPDDPYILDSLGWVLYRRGDLTGARRLMVRAVQIDPYDPEILRHLGDVFRASGLERQAQARYRLALSRNPSIALRKILELRLKTMGSTGVRAANREDGHRKDSTP